MNCKNTSVKNTIDEQLLFPFIDKNEWVPSKYPGTEETYEICKETQQIRNRKSKRIIAQREDKDRYIRCKLNINGKQHFAYVHRVIAYTFIDNPDPTHKIQVDHIDGNKTNNRPENLRWVTPSENIRGFRSESVPYSLILGIDVKTDSVKYKCRSRTDAVTQSGRSSQNIYRAINNLNTIIGGCKWIGYVKEELKESIESKVLSDKYLEGINLEEYI